MSEDIVTRLQWAANGWENAQAMPKQYIPTPAMLREAMTTIAALRAEVERLGRDAERYQWLRQYGNGIQIEIFDLDADILELEPAAQRLDAAVDTAIAQTKERA